MNIAQMRKLLDDISKAAIGSPLCDVCGHIDIDNCGSNVLCKAEGQCAFLQTRSPGSDIQSSPHTVKELARKWQSS